MALIICPECKNEVSSAAESCTHCGYPIAQYLQQKEYESEVSRLTDKILPCDFKVPYPRIKVCIKCTEPFSSGLGDGFRKPVCKCGMPGVEVDYQERYGGAGHLATMAYILESCAIPRNIGDTESDEYKSYVKRLYDRMVVCNCSTKREPPNPKYFGWEPTSEDFSNAKQAIEDLHKSMSNNTSNVPKCPICQSTNLSKLSNTKSFLKISIFGILGAGDLGKTWRCNKCGSKF